MNRIEYINKINSCAARFVHEVEGFTAIGNYHINIHSENFLVPLLNEVFGLELENLNSTKKKNFPAIDLADFKNRVAFQVTSTSSFDKIKSTLETFAKHELQNEFDVLYFYILTERKPQYNDANLTDIIPENFVFESGEHIIDRDVILQKINAISSTPKIHAISKLYEHEFSDIQIEQRKLKFENGYLNNEPEEISPNMVKITFPRTLYKAELFIDEEAILENLNDYLQSIGKKKVKKLKPNNLVKKALKQNQIHFEDWILFEKCIYTFRNLSKSSEPLRKIIDVGTITSLDCDDFYEQTEANNRVFKNLLRKALIQLCYYRGIEFFPPRRIFRFVSSRPPKAKQIRWKGKKESTKTVIFEMTNKKEGHIICYRHLAFKASFLNFKRDWYLVINPTWSFTNPGGYKESRYESAYMAGIKRLENNNSVYNYFRFFAYYLSYMDLFTTYYPYLEPSKIEPMSLSPSLDEQKWVPVKIIEEMSGSVPLEISPDNELTNATFFD
ncbi:SMEK domain-containing protein [Flavobacterium sp.]|uniref:SMEK domain-containing protein n=1 Tax=Flavobacterium sp. TaxID=239 RepID=UPI002603C8D4|nr:SMEK domain-containing protein [Flavobacterium sp.]